MKELTSILLLVNLTMKSVYGLPRVVPTVTTSKGVIKGLEADDGNYDMYLGIPYGIVDENNPFGPASMHPGFNTTFEAFDDTTICPQINDFAIGSIQCLQLNVYVPKTASATNLLPVIVYQHGGSYIKGSKSKSNTSPQLLLKHDVIFVSINYRLGPFGFLCVSQPEVNNQAMKDQRLAYKWVRENIDGFYGDVDRITAVGQSAGAMTLDILLLAEENLAQRAIIMSGTSLTPWVVVTKNDSVPINIAKELGYNNDDLTEALDYLTNQDPLDVIRVVKDLNMMNKHPSTRPCIEGEVTNALLTDYPVNLRPKVKGMDIMIGHTNKEAMFLYPNSDEQFYESYMFANELEFEFNEIYNEDVMKHFYVADRELNIDSKDAILDFASDFAFVYAAERTIDRYLESGANVFRYLFTYEGERNRNKMRNNLTSDGACHGDDLGYLFDSALYADEIQEEDQKMIDVMTTLWTNFAKYGNPTPSPTDVIPFTWQATGLSQRTYLNIGKPVTPDSRPFADRMAFWELYYELYGNKVKGYKINNFN